MSPRATYHPEPALATPPKLLAEILADVATLDHSGRLVAIKGKCPFERHRLNGHGCALFLLPKQTSFMCPRCQLSGGSEELAALLREKGGR